MPAAARASLSAYENQNWRPRSPAERLGSPFRRGVTSFGREELTPNDKRERARCIREAALGFEEPTARTMRELADDLDAEAAAEDGTAAPQPSVAPQRGA